MNDPEVIKFINEHSRIAANKLSAAYLESIQHLAAFDGIKDKLPNDTSPVEDGRESEGISRLVCAEVHGLKTIIQSIVSSLEANDYILRNLVFKVSTSKGQ